jgi:replication factor C subunit 2/4
MTAGAQQALRRTMEIYSTTTRFALACNISSKIIEPIQSRCAVVRFSKLTDSQVFSRVKAVAKMEALNVTPEALEAIVFSADGDLRLALNNLQASSGATLTDNAIIDADTVFRVCDAPPPAAAARILLACSKKQIDVAVDELHHLLKQGYAAVDLITTLFRVVKNAPSSSPPVAKGNDGKPVSVLVLPEYLKLEYVKEIGKTHINILEGCATEVQLAGLVARLVRIGMEPHEFEL